MISTAKSKTVGIVIETNDPETFWIAVRCATYHRAENSDVRIYFLGPGIKYQSIHHENFNTEKLVDIFTQAGGQFWVCDDRDQLKKCLMEHFGARLHKHDIIAIGDDDIFRSTMTENVYIRKFKKIV